MLKLNIGFNRKSGEANYGSRGASVNLELECDAGLASEPDRLRERIRFLFGLAKASVEEELNGPYASGQNTSNHAANGHAAAASSNGSGHGNGHGSGHSNGHVNGQRRDGTRRATASQVRALFAIADRQGIELGDLLRSRYGVAQADELAITEASALIDDLKGQSQQPGGRR